MKTTNDVATLPEVKKNIRALLISAPRGLSVADIEHDYQAMLGKPLPYARFNCKDAFEFLKTMPDVVCPTWCNGALILKGIADESSKHIAKLVSRQRVNLSKSRRIARAPINTKPLVVPTYFRRNIKELLSVYPNGVLGSALSQAYARHYGEEISYSKLGFKSMSQFLNAMQDIATIVKNPKGGYRICAVVRKKQSKTPPPSDQTKSFVPVSQKPSPTPNVSSTKTQLSITVASTCSPSSTIVTQKPTNLNSLEGSVDTKKDHDRRSVEEVKNLLDTKTGVSETMKDELISVLAKRPNGVWAARLPFEYKMLLGKELNVLSTGFYSIIELASAMPDIFRIERPFPNGDWLLFLAAKTRKDKNITKVEVPENVVGKGVGYQQQSVPEEYYLELYITHIRTPDCFWIQLMKYSAQLEKLQEDMKKFYTSKESAQYMVDESFIKLGQVCVAIFPIDGDWYRGLITARPSQLLVEIFYVDYGNSSQISKSDIRLMKKEFFHLPSQAIKSKLANIKPKMAKWDPCTAHRMNELTENKPLIGLVSDKKDDVLNLCICDTNGKDDVHINDLLVDEHYAEFIPANDEAIPSGVPSEENQKKINQELPLHAIHQQQPTFPDYSIPLNVFTGFSNYDHTLPFPPQMPEDMAPIFEEENPTKDDLDFMRQVCEELSDEISDTALNVVVKRLSLPENKVVHVIKFESKPFVVRSEISALLWDSDVLRAMLRSIKMVVEKELISVEDHEELFDDLRRLKVADFADSEKPKEYASLYPLSSIPAILEAFNAPSDLVEMLRNELAAFQQNPESYWSEECEEGTDESGQSEADEEHDLEELKLAEQALQFARKRILRAMTSGDMSPGENSVDKAEDVEKRLSHIRSLIMAAEAKEMAKDTDGCKESKVTREDNIVEKDNMPNKASPAHIALVKPAGGTTTENREPAPVLDKKSPNIGAYECPTTFTPQYPSWDTFIRQSPQVFTSAPTRPDQHNHVPFDHILDAVTSVNPTNVPKMRTSVPQTSIDICQSSTNIPQTFSKNLPQISSDLLQNFTSTPQHSTDSIRNLMDVNVPDPTYKQRTFLDNEQINKDRFQAARKNIETASSRKKGQNHVLHQPMVRLPMFMPRGSMPYMSYQPPGTGVFPNMPYPGYMGPLHPHILVQQYGSPFPNPHLNPTQR